jgi:uncharacterized membrane protein YdcZ (DUF606 family)
VLIILAITVASPRIGLAATIGIIIAFNLGVAALIDRFAGWLRPDHDHDACARAGVVGRCTAFAFAMSTFRRADHGHVLGSDTVP